jgi:predicted HD phosphohydrolase
MVDLASDAIVPRAVLTVSRRAIRRDRESQNRPSVHRRVAARRYLGVVSHDYMKACSVSRRRIGVARGCGMVG